MKSFYKRIIIIIGVFFLAVGISVFLIYQTYSNLSEQLIRRTSLLLARSVEETLINAADQNLESLTSREKNSVRKLMSSLTTETGSILHILLINDKMKILLSSDKAVEGKKYTSTEELANLTGDQPRVLSKEWEGNFRVVDVIVPLKNKEGNVFGYLRLVLSYKELYLLYKDLSLIFIPITVVFTILIIFTFYFVSRTYTKPLESIKKMASKLNDGDFSYRINYTGNDEFTDTFMSLNRSIEKVNILSESYKKAEKRISALLKFADESIILLDQEGQISSYNDAAVKLFRCDYTDDFTDYFSHIKSQNKELQTVIANAFRGGALETNREMAVWLPDGRSLLTRVSTQVLREESRVNGVLLSFKDLQLLNELQHNLQRSMKFGVIANLASSISHEIKNPLSSLAIHAEVLNVRIKKMQITEDATVTRSLDVLQNEVKRLNRIISQFFNLARIKKTDLNLINLNSILKDVLFLVQQQAIERNIRIESQLDDTIDFIYGDPDQLKQVILNIVLNGFQAIDQNGIVLIKTRSSNDRIFAEIQDDGKGMSAEVQQRLFELYFTTKSDGGGIGLAVSKNIMEAHEGRLTFESVEGKGTKFILDFPRKDKTTQIRRQPIKQ